LNARIAESGKPADIIVTSFGQDAGLGAKRSGKAHT
jgi:hypothetical protein